MTEAYRSDQAASSTGDPTAGRHDVGDDLRATTRSVVSRLPFLLATMLVFGVVGYLVTLAVRDVSYEARATLQVGGAIGGLDPTMDQLLASQEVARTYAALADSPEYVSEALARLGRTTLGDAQVWATVVPDTAVLELVARDSSVESATALADDMASVMVYSPAGVGTQEGVRVVLADTLRTLGGSVDSIRTQLDALYAIEAPTVAQVAQINELEARLGALITTYTEMLPFSDIDSSNTLTVMAPAGDVTTVGASTPLLVAMAAGLVGLLLAGGISYVLSVADPTIRTSRELEKELGIDVLSSIVDRQPIRRGSGHDDGAPTVATYTRTKSASAEAYRRICSAVVLESTKRPIRSVVVAGVRDSVGKSVVAANLAVALAQAGRSTVLVDLDARAPLADLVGLHGTDKLPRTTEVTSRSVWNTAQRGLSLLSATPGGDIHGLLDGLVGLADIAVIDGPPLDASTDTAVAASIADATVLVVDAQRTRTRGARTALATLERARARVLGTVLVQYASKVYSKTADVRGVSPSA